MVDISADDVRKLRDMTGGKMMDCKNALVEAGGSLEQAVDLLRKKGLASADKKAGREAKDGRVFAHIQDGHKIGTMVEVACETDFVAKNDAFMAFVKHLSAHVLHVKPHIELMGPEQVPQLLEQPWSHDKTKSVEQVMKELIAKLGENVVIRRCARFEEHHFGRIFAYVHHDQKKGTMVDVGCGSETIADHEEFKTFLKHLAMHVTAATPHAEYVTADQVSPAAIEREKRIARESDSVKGKPPQTIEKIVEGKVAAYLKTCVLLQQPWIHDDSKTVEQVVKHLSDKLGEKVVVRRFARFEIGA